ncbi:MAG: 16S rRNA (uracil(1498)-N(3))-methyltransferase [Alphaproteobacteria bacterium]
MTAPADAPSIRLYVTHDLTEGAGVPLDAKQVHYLKNVMRLGVGDVLSVFNGRDGEWRAAVAALGRSDGVLETVARAKQQAVEPDLWLVFAPIKKTRLDVLIEKAGELGAARLVPVLTDRSSVRDLNAARAASLTIEAAEQCGRMTVPVVSPIVPLTQLLAAWPAARRLLFCDESGRAPPIAEALAGQPNGPWAALIGPEGGFSPAERDAVAALPQAVPVALGPRILRADTAAIAALSLLQAHLGDWR